jgi:hypothetical protein
MPEERGDYHDMMVGLQTETLIRDLQDMKQGQYKVHRDDNSVISKAFLQKRCHLDVVGGPSTPDDPKAMLVGA